MTTQSTPEGFSPSPVPENPPNPLQPVVKREVSGDDTDGNVDPNAALVQIAGPQYADVQDYNRHRRAWTRYMDPTISNPDGSPKVKPAPLGIHPDLQGQVMRNPGSVAQEVAREREAFSSAERAKAQRAEDMNRVPEIVAGDTAEFVEKRTALLDKMDKVPHLWFKTLNELGGIISRRTNDETPEGRKELVRAINILAELRLKLIQGNNFGDLTKDQLDMLILAKKHVPRAVDALTTNLLSQSKNGVFGEDDTRLTIETLVSHLLCGEPDDLSSTSDLVLARLNLADVKSPFIATIKAIEDRRAPLTQLHKRGEALVSVNKIYEAATKIDWSKLEPAQAEAIIPAVVKWRCERVGVPDDYIANSPTYLMGDLMRIQDPKLLQLSLAAVSKAIEFTYTNDINYNDCRTFADIRRFYTGLVKNAWDIRMNNSNVRSPMEQDYIKQEPMTDAELRTEVFSDWAFKAMLERYFNAITTIDSHYLSYAGLRPAVAGQNLNMVRAKIRELSQLDHPDVWVDTISILRRIEAIGVNGVAPIVS